MTDLYWIDRWTSFIIDNTPQPEARRDPIHVFMTGSHLVLLQLVVLYFISFRSSSIRKCWRSGIAIVVVGTHMMMQDNNGIRSCYYLTEWKCRRKREPNAGPFPSRTSWQIRPVMISILSTRVHDAEIRLANNRADEQCLISIRFVLFDFDPPQGLQELTNYLRKEYSHENIRFWLATNQLRSGPASRILHRVQEIYQFVFFSFTHKAIHFSFHLSLLLLFSRL